MKSLLSIYFLCFSVIIHAQSPDNIAVESQIEDVTVFLNGAEIISTYELELTQGRHEVSITGISSFANESSVQVMLDGNTQLMSVYMQNSLREESNTDPLYMSYCDSLSAIDFQLRQIANEMSAYIDEKLALKSNHYVGGTQSGVSLAVLEQASDFFRNRSIQINNELSELEIKNESLKQHRDKLNAIMEKMASTFNGKRKEIVMQLNVSATGKIPFTLGYLVGEAGWFASYDLMADGIDQPVQLRYKAEVYNDTGIDWNNANLILSTADPSMNADKPELTTWNLNERSISNEGLTDGKAKVSEMRSELVWDLDPTQEVVVDELNTSFTIDEPHTVLSHEMPLIINIGEETLSATYHYYAVPKVDMNVFLLAKVTGWEKLNLIEGPANVYFGNRYLGKSNLSNRLMGDTLSLSFGRDNQVMVSRQKVVDHTSTRFIGSKKTSRFTYEIQVKNNRNRDIDLQLLDQVPISQDDDITVEINNISGAEHHLRSGKLTWNLSLKPGEAKKYIVAFEVKHPKNMDVQITKNRIVKTPRFRH